VSNSAGFMLMNYSMFHVTGKTVEETLDVDCIYFFVSLSHALKSELTINGVGGGG
jgi:hypothetical protein